MIYDSRKHLKNRIKELEEEINHLLARIEELEYQVNTIDYDTGVYT